MQRADDMSRTWLVQVERRERDCLESQPEHCVGYFALVGGEPDVRIAPGNVEEPAPFPWRRGFPQSRTKPIDGDGSRVDGLGEASRNDQGFRLVESVCKPLHPLLKTQHSDRGRDERRRRPGQVDGQGRIALLQHLQSGQSLDQPVVEVVTPGQRTEHPRRQRSCASERRHPDQCPVLRVRDQACARHRFAQQPSGYGVEGRRHVKARPRQLEQSKGSRGVSGIVLIERRGERRRCGVVGVLDPASPRRGHGAAEPQELHAQLTHRFRVGVTEPARQSSAGAELGV